VTVGTFAQRDVLLERERQITAEGCDLAHDDDHQCGELAVAAACYAFYAGNQAPSRHEYLPGWEAWVRQVWPWEMEWWKPKPEARRNLVRAAALLIAEIERIDRKGER
jgi:hypothetical protein